MPEPKYNEGDLVSYNVKSGQSVEQGWIEKIISYGSEPNQTHQYKISGRESPINEDDIGQVIEKGNKNS